MDDLVHSIIPDNRIRCGALDVVSDARIKTIISPANGKADLATLLRIQITDYKHIDVPNQRQRPQKKVIAQQVEQVYPQGVGQSNGVVPDIYQKAAIKDGWIDASRVHEFAPCRPQRLEQRLEAPHPGLLAPQQIADRLGQFPQKRLGH